MVPDCFVFLPGKKKSVSLLGLVVDAQPLLDDPGLIKLIKSSGLLLATYGSLKYSCHLLHAMLHQLLTFPSNSNEAENVRVQEELGVDAVISDHFIIPRHTTQ